MCRRIAQWDRGHGFSGIRNDWLAAAHDIGRSISVRNGNSEKHGRFAGLDQSGCLLLELSGGAIEKISAGDVFAFDIADEQRASGGLG
jgi:BirA family biotin operon repressor/biotin-[acetyl-CoA-carboxylase] ligase